MTGNTFFLVTFLMLMQSGPFLRIVLGTLVLFPLSGDPLGKIPAERLALWPLSRRNAILLRMASVWFSPAAWITIGLLIWVAQPAFALMFLGVTLLFALVSGRIPALNPLRQIPDFGGPLGGLIRKNLRELLTILDPYLGLVLSIGGTLYRVLSSHFEENALLILSLLIVLSMSTYALCLFGLDTAAGFTRYRLLPLSGWLILAAKDAAFLLVLLPLVLPLAPLAALAGASVVLAVGHYASLNARTVQRRWRFTGGAPLGPALLQVFLLFSAGSMVFHSSRLVLGPCLLLYLASLWYCGRQWDRMSLG